MNGEMLRRRPHLLYIAGGLALGLAYFAAPMGQLGETAVYNVVAWATPFAIAAGILLYRPPRPLAWWLLAASQLLWGAGDLVWELLAVDGEAPYPGPADVLYLLGYLLLAGGLVVLARTVSSRCEAGQMIDTLIVGIAVALLAWPWVFEPNLEAGGPLAAAVTVAYPLFDIAFASLLFRLALASSGTGAVRLLTLGVVFLFAADIVYTAPALAGAYAVGSWHDAGWLASYVAMAAAALHPSLGRVAGSADRGRRRLPRWRLVAVAAAFVIMPAAALIALLANGIETIDVIVFIAAALVVFPLVLTRVALLLHEVERLRQAAEASERKFRAVFDSAGVGISIGADGMMTETNAAYQRMLGYTGEELAGMHFLDVTHPDDRDRVAAQPDVSEGSAITIEKRYVRKDGSVRWAGATITQAHGADFGIAIVEDVTARRELEEELRQAQKMEAVGQLAGGVAHDFNNLLMAISGYAELALGRLPDGDRTRRDVEEIARSAARAAELTQRLLAFSRRQVLRPATMDLNEAVESAGTLLRRLMGSEIEVTTELGEGLPAVRTDPAQLEQIVVNLAVNARDAMPNGGRLTVVTYGADLGEEQAAARELEPGPYVVVEVADTGDGMDEETRRHAFEPFFTTKPPGQGSGLGLSMVYGAVRQSGGAAEIESACGEGTLVRIFLPASDAPADAPASPPRGHTAGESLQEADRILLVEDEPAVAALIRDVLEEAGYAVDHAGDPQQGLLLAETAGPFDLLVTDLVMPHMNGRRLAEEVLLRHPGTPVLYISGYPGDQVIARGLLEPGTPFIEKPFALGDFLAHVRELLSRAPAVA